MAELPVANGFDCADDDPNPSVPNMFIHTKKLACDVCFYVMFFSEKPSLKLRGY